MFTLDKTVEYLIMLNIIFFSKLIFKKINKE